MTRSAHPSRAVSWSISAVVRDTSDANNPEG
jgi:hypothetical protein